MARFIDLKISLDKSEWLALRTYAQQERREPAAQVAVILRSVLLGGSNDRPTIERLLVDSDRLVEPSP
ncbi:MAG: hypothetical protein R3C14_28705 [Caldilineaceae bacterium]